LIRSRAKFTEFVRGKLLTAKPHEKRNRKTRAATTTRTAAAAAAAAW